MIAFGIKFFFLIFIFLYAEEENKENTLKKDYNFKKQQAELIKEFVKNAEYGNFVEVRKAVETQLIDLNSQDKRGLTALHAAAQNGQMEIIRYLLQFKIDINTTSKAKETPLLSALARSHIGIAKLLMENGADVNAVNAKGETPLMLASGNGSLEICQALVEKKANLNQKDNEGNTALIHAIRSGNVDIVKYLVEQKVDVNLKNKAGKSAVQIATESGLTDIVEFLSKNKERPAVKNEIFVGTAGVLETGIIQIKPQPKLELWEGQVIYFLNEEGEEIGFGKITISTPKFIRVKIQTGQIKNGDKAVFYK